MTKKFLLLICLSFNMLAFDLWQADRLYENKDYANAQVAYQKIVEQLPDNFEAFYNLGKSYYKQNNFNDAKEAFKNVVDHVGNGQRQFNPKLAEPAYFNLGDTEIKLNQLQEALKSFEQVLKINAENKKAKERIELIKKLLEEQKKEQEKQQQEQKQEKEKSGQEKNEKIGDEGKQEREKENKKSEEKNKEQRDQEQKEGDSKGSGAEQSAQQNKGQSKNPQQSHEDAKEHAKNQNQSNANQRGEQGKEAGSNKPEQKQGEQEKQSDKDKFHEGSENKKNIDKGKQNLQKVQLPSSLEQSKAEKNLGDIDKKVLQIIEKDDADLRQQLINAQVSALGISDEEKNW